MDQHPLKHIIEAALLTAGRPLNMQHLQQLLTDGEEPLAKEIVQAGLDGLSEDLENRGIELRLVASGYRLQVRQSLEPWIARLFEERPPRYSRALLETLALIGYRQPITRAEIEDVRGVSVSSNIIRTLLEREWVKVVGHRDVPGRPSMYGTTKQFLDYFNLKSLAELPELGELMDLDKASTEFDKANGIAANDGETEKGEGEQDAAESSDSDEAEKEAAASTDEGDASPGEKSDETSGPTDEVEDSAKLQAVETPSESEPEQSEAEEELADTAEIPVDVSLVTEALDEEDGAFQEDGESQEDIDADVESLIRMLDAESGATGSTADGKPEIIGAETSPDTNPEPAETSADEQPQHEAARGETITPADLLRRHSTDVEQQ